jgi:hypothetical protein
VSTPE